MCLKLKHWEIIVEQIGKSYKIPTYETGYFKNVNHTSATGNESGKKNDWLSSTFS